MSGDVKAPNAFGLMMANAALGRVINYRQQAAQFRELAKTESDEKLRRNLLKLAEQYDALAGEPTVASVPVPPASRGADKGA